MKELLNLDNTAERTHSHSFLLCGETWLVNFLCLASSIFIFVFCNRWVNRITRLQLMLFPRYLIWEAIRASECEIRHVNWHSPSSIRKSNSTLTVIVDNVFEACHFLIKEYVHLDIVQFYLFKLAAGFILCCMSAGVMKASIELKPFLPAALSIQALD